MSTHPHYDTLGVAQDASPVDIKTAYRELSKRYHPDNLTTGDEAKFKEIAAAYTILSDPAQRKAYDLNPNAGRGFGGRKPGAQKKGRPDANPLAKYNAEIKRIEAEFATVRSELARRLADELRDIDLRRRAFASSLVAQQSQFDLALERERIRIDGELAAAEKVAEDAFDHRHAELQRQAQSGAVSANKALATLADAAATCLAAWEKASRRHADALVAIEQRRSGGQSQQLDKANANFDREELLAQRRESDRLKVAETKRAADLAAAEALKPKP